MLKKAASGVPWLCRNGLPGIVGILPPSGSQTCRSSRRSRSHTKITLRASKWLRPCWTNFFEHSLPLMLVVLSEAFMGRGHEIFNRPLVIDALKE